MKRYYFAAIIIMLHFGCKKDSNTKLPNCIEQKIVIAMITACSNGASIDSYLFQGKTVYVMDLQHGCIADDLIPVLDNQCNIIGTIGGLAGFNIVNGENFSNAKFIKNVWKK